MKISRICSGLMLLVVLPVAAPAQNTTKAEVFSAAEVRQQMSELTPQATRQGSSGSVLGDYGSHSIRLSVRGSTGGAEVHARFDDVMLVMGGKATLVTGGTVINPQTGVDGETKGTGIRDGVSRPIAQGDIVHVPAGIPHQLIIPKGTVFSALVVKVRE